MRILVVDDHAELRQLTVQFVELLGHTALAARNADEAQRAFERAGDIDVALLDLQLGAVNGVQLADKLEQARPGLRVLFMSGYNREELAPADTDRPHRQFIEKPFTVTALDAALANLMRSK